MSRTLPEVTELPHSPIPRAHAPKEADYRTYRACLRWDFGFTCLFCLRHETDIIPSGAEGWGVTSAEHLMLQSKNPADANKYANVVYCCKRCNRDRGTKPIIDSAGRRLLDPTKDAWDSHFALDGEAIRPKLSDADAEYTERAYNMNAEKKRDARRIRRESLRTLLERIQLLREVEAQFIERAREADDNDKRLELIRMAHRLRSDQGAVVVDLVRRHRAVPVDAPSACRCAKPPKLELPAWFGDQCVPAPSV